MLWIIKHCFLIFLIGTSKIERKEGPEEGSREKEKSPGNPGVVRERYW